MPGAATIGGLKEPASGAVEFVAVLPRALTDLPHRGVEGIGIRSVDLHIGGAGVLILREHLLPLLPAIGRTIEPALLVGSIRMPKHGSEHAVRVARINGERGNLLTVFQPKVRPALAGVGRFVNAIANR